MSAVTAVKHPLVSHIYLMKCLGALHHTRSGGWGKQELQTSTLAMAGMSECQLQLKAMHAQRLWECRRQSKLGWR